MKLQPLDFKELTVGVPLETPGGNRIFVPNQSTRAEEPPPPPVFSEEELKAAERDAYKKGFLEGEQEGRRQAESEQADVNRRLVAMLDSFVQAVSPLFGHYRDMAAQARGNLPALAVAIARKVAADALDKNAEDVVVRIALECCETMMGEPELAIVAHESVADTLEQHLQELAARLPDATRIVIVRDPGMPLADCRIEWKNGSLERVTARLWEQVENAAATMKVVTLRESAADAEELEKRLSPATDTSSSEKGVSHG